MLMIHIYMSRLLAATREAQNLLKLHESEVHLFGHPTLTSYPKNNLGTYHVTSMLIISV